MPSNKNASLRYKIINTCLTTLGRQRWTKEELVERVSEQLRAHGFLGADNISISTLEKDIAFLKRHHEAPIRCKEGRYFYSDPDFDLEKKPLKPEEIKLLQEAFALLHQFPNLPHLEALETLLHKMKGGKLDFGAQIIQFENNPHVKGLNWLGPLYNYIQEQKVCNIEYQAFNAPSENIIFHPYLLKEWRNRWYVVGRHQEKQAAWNLALDRIQRIQPSIRPFLPNDLFDPLTRYHDVIGVTVNEGPVQEIVFRCNKSICGYLHTKPLHPSQRLLESRDDYEVFSIRVIPNAEAYGELYRFGNNLEVL